MTQPNPTPNNGPHIHDLVTWDLALRKHQGTTTYGAPLQAHNGRDALWDAYEEALDLAVYLRQAIAERDSPETNSVGNAPSPGTGSDTAPPAP